MHENLRARLLTVAARVAWNVLPQGQALPAIRLQQISGAVEEHYEGPFEAQSARVQMDCDALTFAEADALANTAWSAIKMPFTQGNTVFPRIFNESRRDTHEEGQAALIHRISIDLIVWHKEI